MKVFAHTCVLWFSLLYFSSSPHAMASEEIYRCKNKSAKSETTYTAVASPQDIQSGVCEKITQTSVSTVPSGLRENQGYSKQYEAPKTAEKNQQAVKKNKATPPQVWQDKWAALLQEKTDLEAQLKTLEDRRFRAENGQTRYRYLAPDIQERIKKVDTDLSQYPMPNEKK